MDILTSTLFNFIDKKIDIFRGMMKLANKELIEEYYEKIPELLSQPKVSFLIGAGCSRCAGLPIMNELTNEICEELQPDW